MYKRQLVGINLLREGLDIPEIELVAILDADKEGFLRNETSLIQTIGRAARNAQGRVILYADTITRSIKAAVSETERRRALQKEYNEKHGITPTSISKEVSEALAISQKADEEDAIKNLSREERGMRIDILTQQMKQAAAELEFEVAAKLRDMIEELQKKKK